MSLNVSTATRAERRESSPSNILSARDSHSNSKQTSSSSEDEEATSSTNKEPGRRGRKPKLTKELIVQYFDYSQTEAAIMLGVSLSTLKRKFYALNMGQWPCKVKKQSQKKKTLRYILNTTEPNNPKRVDYRTLQILTEVFNKDQCGTNTDTQINPAQQPAILFNK